MCSVSFGAVIQNRFDGTKFESAKILSEKLRRAQVLFDSALIFPARSAKVFTSGVSS